MLGQELACKNTALVHAGHCGLQYGLPANGSGIQIHQGLRSTGHEKTTALIEAQGSPTSFFRPERSLRKTCNPDRKVFEKESRM